MPHIRCALFAVCCLVGAGSSIGAELVVLTPIMAGDKAVLRAGPKGEPQAPILKRAPTDVLTKSIAVEATRGTLKFMLALDEHAQRAAGIGTPGPTYLVMARNANSFARNGFWLGDTTNNLVWHADPYVELEIDKQSIADGRFEEDFAHELGHAMLRRLVPRLPNGLSRAAHASLSVTDYPSAFDEGFAIHFQGLARHLTQNNGLKATDKGLDYKPFVTLWQSDRNRELRVQGMRQNLFIHLQIPTAAQAADSSPQFDLTHFKNGQQMLSSEGVIATLFYHLMVHTADTPAARAERYKSLLTSVRLLNGQRLTSGTPIFLNLAQAHIQRVPDAKALWIGTVMNVTYGATAGPTAVRDLHKLAALGNEGRTEEFQAALKQSRAALASLADQVTRNPQRLGAAVGAELWLAVKRENEEPMTINLNTAEKAGLMEVLGYESMDADFLLADRATRGAFANIEDFAARRKAPPLMRKRLVDAQQLVTRIGAFERD